jgi:hypothetical protein
MEVIVEERGGKEGKKEKKGLERGGSIAVGGYIVEV